MSIRPVLLGFSDFFDEVGGPVPVGKPKGTVAPPPKTGAPPSPQKLVKIRPYGKVKPTLVTRQHAKVLNKAKGALLKAARSLGKAQVSLAKKPPAAATVTAKAAMLNAATKATVAKQAAMQAKAQPSVSTMKAAAVTRGIASKAILGAVTAMVKAAKPVAPVVTKKLSAKAKAAVDKHNKALVEAKKAAQKLAQQTLKTRKTVKALAQAALNQKKVSKALRTKGAGKTHVGHYFLTHPAVAEALGEYYESVGAEPDPNAPGLLTDGTLDPAWVDSSSAGMPDLISESEISALSDDDQDALDSINAAAGQPPPDADDPGSAPTVADYKAVGGILYNESKGRPNGFCGSFGLFTRRSSNDAPGGAVAGSDPGVNDYGYVWGSFDQDNVPNGTPWGGRLSENEWNHLHGRFVRGMPGSFNETVSPSEAYSSNSKLSPYGASYGPLIGNPGLADFKGMRVDAQGNMFWYPQEAPDWLTFPLKQAAMLTEAKLQKALEDEKKQFALEEEKTRRDEAATQAAQDAANALAESAAVSEGKVAAVAEQTAQAQQETAYQQTQVEQAQQETAAQQELVQAQHAETEQNVAQAAQEQAAQQIIIQRAQRQEALMAENPDIELALMAQQAGVLGPEEGEEAPAEEGGEEEAPLTDDDAADYNEDGSADIDYSSDEGSSFDSGDITEG